MRPTPRSLAALPAAALLALASWACGDSGEGGDGLDSVEIQAVVERLFEETFLTDGLRNGIRPPIQSLLPETTFDAAEISSFVCIDGGSHVPTTTSGQADGTAVFGVSHTLTACERGPADSPSGRVVDGQTIWTGFGNSVLGERVDGEIVSRGNGTVTSTLAVQWLSEDTADAIDGECTLDGSWRFVSAADADDLVFVSEAEDLDATLRCGSRAWRCTLVSGACTPL